MQTAAKLTVVVTVQAVAGAMLWSLVRRGQQLPAAELIGVGLALGTLMSLLAYQLLRTTDIAGIAWLVPMAVVCIAVAGSVPRAATLLEPARRARSPRTRSRSCCRCRLPHPILAASSTLVWRLAALLRRHSLPRGACQLGHYLGSERQHSGRWPRHQLPLVLSRLVWNDDRRCTAPSRMSSLPGRCRLSRLSARPVSVVLGAATTATLRGYHIAVLLVVGGLYVGR